MLGQILSGRYKIISSLGSGAFGATYIAEDQQLPDTPRCVVKQLKPTSHDPSNLVVARRLFETEAKVLHRLGSHDRIPRLLAHFEENHQFYLVQELIEGHPLTQEIKLGQKCNEAYVIALLQDILSTLAFVQAQNVIHRDIKPSNIIRRTSDNKLVLIDFGAVKQITNQGVNSQDPQGITVAIGTPGYIPSEQLAGIPRPNSDIYAVGMMAIQALTGVPPSQLNPDPESYELMWRNKAPEVSDRLAAILNRMVRSQAIERYQSATEVLTDLASLNNLAIAPTVAISSPLDPTVVAPTSGIPGSGSTLPQAGSTLPQSNASNSSLSPGKNSQQPVKIWAIGAGVGLLLIGGIFFSLKFKLGQDNNCEKLIQSEQPAEALTACDRFLAIQPNNAQTWKNRGDALFLLERYEASLAAFDKAIKLNDKDPEGWNKRGKALYKLQRYEESISAYDKSKDLDPNDPRAWNGRGLALIGLKRYDEALADFDKARTIKPDNPISWENRALALEYLNRPQEARQAYEEALASYNDRLKSQPNDERTMIDRGALLNKLERYEEALKAFENAIAIKADYFDAWTAKGDTLLLLQRPEDALKAYDKALQLRPQSYQTWHNRGSLLAGSLQRLEDAVTSFDKALEINSDFYHAWREKGMVLNQLERDSEALASFDKALKIEPNDYKSWEGRGIVLTKMKRYDEALAAFDKAISIKNDDAYTWANKAFALEKAGRKQDAIAAYDKAIEIQPDFTEAIEARRKLKR